MYGVPEKLGPGKRVCGFLIQKELQFLGNALQDPAQPFLAILGGAKVSDKIPVIQNLINKVDTIIIGGAMSYTFLKAQQIDIGNSKLEADMVPHAAHLLQAAQQTGCEMLLPTNHVKIAQAKTVVWNGPMGVFETPPFDAGTRAVAQAIADTDCISIIGGGDSAAAVQAFGLEKKMSHVSTGGGASLEFLAGKPFPALEILDEA